MDWLSVDTASCSVQRALDVIGDRWTILVLREVFNGVRRFDQIKAHTGVSDSVLAGRLRHLVAEGVLVGEEYREPGARARKQYRLTDAGLALQPVMLSLMQWGDEFRSDGRPPAVVARHRDCGAPVRTAVICTEGHVVDDPREVRSTPGSGARVT